MEEFVDLPAKHQLINSSVRPELKRELGYECKVQVWVKYGKRSAYRYGVAAHHMIGTAHEKTDQGTCHEEAHEGSVYDRHGLAVGIKGFV